jgi:hypothetical protein
MRLGLPTLLFFLVGCAANPRVEPDGGPDSVCGDGIATGGEACDGPCCNDTCSGPATSGTLCRPVAGDCDVAEVCNGTAPSCPPDTFMSPGETCREASGDCDEAERCGGSNAQCPADELAAEGTECRASMGDCDIAEQCDGESAACPEDALAADTHVCRPRTSGCDDDELCDGASVDCPEDTGESPPAIGLYAADDAPAHVSVRDFMEGVGTLGTVSIAGPVTTTFVPTLEDLLRYDAVFVWGSASWDGERFGDVLAQYVEMGGGVVIAVFAQRAGGFVGVAGRMQSAGYLPYVPADHGVADIALGAIAMPEHPIMEGVESLSGTAFQFHNGTISTGATLIASMNNARPLVATLEPSEGRTVLLGFYPVRLWDTSTDGARLMANAAHWAACGE